MQKVDWAVQAYYEEINDDEKEMERIIKRIEKLESETEKLKERLYYDDLPESREKIYRKKLKDRKIQLENYRQRYDALERMDLDHFEGALF